MPNVPLAAWTFSPIFIHRRWCRGATNSKPPRGRTCHIRGSGGGGGCPPPGSLLYATHDSVKVNLEVIPTHLPPPGIPQPVMKLSSMYAGRKYCTLSLTVAPPPTQVLSPACSWHSDGAPTTPPPELSHIPVTGIYPSDYPSSYAPLPSYSLCTPTLTGYPRTCTVGIPFLPSLLYCSAGQPSQTGLSRCPVLPVTRLAAGTPEIRRLCWRQRPVFVSPSQRLSLLRLLFPHLSLSGVWPRPPLYWIYWGTAVRPAWPLWTLKMGIHSSAPPGVPWWFFPSYSIRGVPSLD